jgi:hypothetical protein
VDESGFYTAPDAPCEAVVTAICGETAGVLRIPVIAQPERISILREESAKEVKQLRVLPGSETELNAQAFWNGMKVCCSDEQFEWSLEGDIGTVDETGRFIASRKAASGSLTVRCGEVSCTVHAAVTDWVICAEDFEQAEPGGAPGLIWSQETNRDKVKYGRGSLRLDYDLAEGSVVLPMDEYPTELENSAAFWLLSDGSGNKVYSVHENITLLLGTLDHKGWMLFTADTGSCGRMAALRIDGEGSGTLWLDQLVLFSAEEADTEAPVLRLEAEDGFLTAEVQDHYEGILPVQQLALSVNGEAWPFEYDEQTGVLTAPVPETGQSARVILTAADRSGNYNSSELLVKEGGESGFPDMTDHWAQPYADHLQSIGILAGRLADDGSTYFDPDARLTRAEFAVMLCRWLRVDLSAYSDGLHFVDENDIPAWAKESVRAAASLGLIHGSASGNGLYFAPQDPLTRAQAAVILGRTMPGGRMKSDLPWPDAEDIPAWSRVYVSELAFMGIMKGNGDIFAPNAPITRAEAAKMLSQLT